MIVQVEVRPEDETNSCRGAGKYCVLAQAIYRHVRSGVGVGVYPYPVGVVGPTVVFITETEYRETPLAPRAADLARRFDNNHTLHLPFTFPLDIPDEFLRQPQEQP